MSPVGAIFVPFPPKTGTSLLNPRPPQSLNGSRVKILTRSDHQKTLETYRHHDDVYYMEINAHKYVCIV